MSAEPYPRMLSFSAAYNVRDVGGYPGLDGRTVRWRRLLRADALHRLTGDADRAAFAELGVRTVVDLRRDFEVAAHGRAPDTGGLTYVDAVVEHVDWNDLPEPAGVPHERWLADRYLNFAEDGRAGLALALRTIADPGRAPVVVHCMAGKDRTGVVCALTLSLLGVADDDVAADYALTTTAMAGLVRHLKANDPEVIDGKEHMFDSPAEAMLLFLADLRARHGSVEGFVREVGLTADELASLRGHLLEPTPT